MFIHEDLVVTIFFIPMVASWKWLWTVRLAAGTLGRRLQAHYHQKSYISLNNKKVTGLHTLGYKNQALIYHF